MVDYCTCVVTRVYRSTRDGSLVPESPPAVPNVEPSFTVDLRSGALTGGYFKASPSAGPRVWRAPDQESWVVVWPPLPTAPPGALLSLRLEGQPATGAGERPISFVAASAVQSFAGVCLPAPPAGIRSD